jgi:hypothetical protein
MPYAPPGSWGSDCVNQLLFGLGCTGGYIQFTVTYFVSGACPDGQSQSCHNPGSAPFAFTLADYTCDPFHLHYTVTGTNCPLVYESGYTDIYVDESD